MTAIRPEQLEAMGPGACAACEPAVYGAALVTRPAPRPAGPPVVIASREEPGWVAIQLVDENGQPVPGEPYRVTPASGPPIEGVLDANGSARIEGVAPGTCKVTFPERDKDGWRTATGAERSKAKAGA